MSTHRSESQGENETAHRPTQPPKAGRRPLLDPGQPNGFVRYPYYTVSEMSAIFAISADLVRTLFRNGKQGPVIEIWNQKPGKRTYRTLLIPYSTVVCFIARFTKERTVAASNERRMPLRFAA